MGILKMDIVFEHSAEFDAQVDLFERLQREQLKQKRYERCGIGERYFSEGFATFKTETEEQKTLLALMKDFTNAVKNGEYRTLVLLGNCGTGKTHLAGGALRELGGHYYESISLVEKIKKGCEFGSKETPLRILDNLLEERLTVIDEIGRAKNVDEQRELFRVFNAMYNTRHSSILIGNFVNQKAFFDYVGGAFVDRLSESGVVFETKGESYRLKKWQQ